MLETPLATDDEPPAGGDQPRVIERPRTKGDRIYHRIAAGAGASSLVLMGFIALFLLLSGLDAFRSQGFGFLTNFEWQTNADPPTFGVAAMMYGTLVVAVIALVIAVPVAVSAALFISEIAPRRLKGSLTSLIDLLAAIPSLIYGIWGLLFLQDLLFGTFNWMADYLAWIPGFDSSQRIFAGSLFMCGVVVSLMVVPITCSVTREVFSQAPPFEREGALALGSTRWGMIRTVVLPFGRGGIVGGSMLGLGRALGETIAVALILSPRYEVQTEILEPGGATVASTIAIEFGEATSLGVSALMAAGLMLFIVTLGVNMLASLVVKRSRSGSGVEI